MNGWWTSRNLRQNEKGYPRSGCWRAECRAEIRNPLTVISCGITRGISNLRRGSRAKTRGSRMKSRSVEQDRGNRSRFARTTSRLEPVN